MTFEEALERVLRYEGGYVDNPNDPGGATNKGVTQAVYDAWRRSQGLAVRPVRGIEDGEVRAIYRERYWKAARADEMPPALRLVQFDAAVNCGVKMAIRFLQRALGVADDGVIGPVTLGALQKRQIRPLADEVLWERLRYYRTIAVRQRPDGRDLRVFLPGWIARLLDVQAQLPEAG